MKTSIKIKQYLLNKYPFIETELEHYAKLYNAEILKEKIAEIEEIRDEYGNGDKDQIIKLAFTHALRILNK